MSIAAKDLARWEEAPHGTRSRYVRGKCRCDACRAANARYYHERQARLKVMAAGVAGELQPCPRTWTTREGKQRTAVYRRACPGLNGKRCPAGSHLRKDSSGGICGVCREMLLGGKHVSAERARKHLLKLSRAGVGRRAVAAACDCSATSLQLIRSGRKTQIRKSTEQRILAVDQKALSDGALVPARGTWRRMERLIQSGEFSKAELARRLGIRLGNLRIGETQLVRASTELRVRKLWRDAMGVW